MSWLTFWRRSRKGQAAVAQREARGEDVPYMLPTNLNEVNRLDFQHYMLRYAMQGNYAAPITAPHGILDAACGTGRWAIEMATIFPNANVVGLDIAPPPIETASAERRPDNFAFIQGNLLERLPFADNTFDYAHQRLLIAALPSDQWVPVARELLRVTRPGGWVELVEGGLFAGGPGMQVLNDVSEQLSQRRNLSFTNALRVDEYLRAAGAQNVERRLVYVPVGRQQGRLGAMAETDYLAIIASLRPLFLKLNLISEERLDQAIEQAKPELASGQLAWPFYIAYGQKA